MDDKDKKTIEALFHPAYGLEASTRLRAIRDAEIFGVRRAAEMHKLSDTVVYNWRKRMREHMPEQNSGWRRVGQILKDLKFYE